MLKVQVRLNKRRNTPYIIGLMTQSYLYKDRREGLPHVLSKNSLPHIMQVYPETQNRLGVVFGRRLLMLVGKSLNPKPRGTRQPTLLIMSCFL